MLPVPHIKDLLEHLAQSFGRKNDVSVPKETVATHLSALYYARLVGMEPGGNSKKADLLALEMNWKFVKKILVEGHEEFHKDLRSLRLSTPQFEEDGYRMELDKIDLQNRVAQGIQKSFQEGGMTDFEILSVEQIVYPNEERQHFNRTRERVKKEYGD